MSVIPPWEASPVYAAGTVDVIVVGAGPAGLVTALQLARAGLTVTILDSRRSIGHRIGEIASPPLTPILNKLRFTQTLLLRNHLASEGVSLWWGSAERSDWDYIRNPYGCGWHLDRVHFESALASAVQNAGAVILWDARVVRCNPGARRGWIVETSRKQQAFDCKFLVNAAARSAAFCSISGPRIRFDRLVAFYTYAMPEEHKPEPEPRLWVESNRSGWWYTAPVPGRQLIAAFLTDPDLVDQPCATFFASRLSESSRSSERLRDCRLGAIRTACANTTKARRIIQLDYLVSGKARIGIVDPKTHQNIDMQPGDVCFIPQGHLHWIENTGTEPVHFLLTLSHENPQTIELSEMIVAAPK